MSATDPLATVRDALEAHDYGPHGGAWDFYARCPAHNGDGRSLHISTGADGRVVLYCFAHQCEPKTIVEAVGLTMRDLFPAGHRHARRIALPPVRRSDLDGGALKVANVLSSAQMLGWDYQVRIDTACANCGAECAELVVWPDGTTTLFCPEHCTAREFTGALAGRVIDVAAADRRTGR